MSPTQKFEPKNSIVKKKPCAPTEVIQEDISSDCEYEELSKEFKGFYEKVVAKYVTRAKVKTNRNLNVLKEKYNSEKQKNRKLEEENIKLTKEYEKQCDLIMSQNELIKELKKKFEEEKADTLIKERDKLSKENLRLMQEVKQLKEELNKAKESINNSKENAKTRNATTKQFNMTASQSYGKPKFKKPSIPKLDFSKLPQKKQAVLKVIQCKEKTSAEESFDISISSKDELASLGKTCPDFA
jgi:hypothetical protein